MGISRLRLLFVVNWVEEGRWSLFRAVAERTRVAHCLGAVRVTAAFRKLSKRLSQFYVPVLALFKRNGYDVVLTWSMRMAIIYGLLNRLFRSPLSPKHIMYDFHINLTRRDLFYRMRLKLLLLALPGIDFFLCTSTREEEIYSKMFGISRERIRFFPMATPNEYLLDHHYEPKDYILSYGNSDRDYDTLIAAVADLGARLVILSQSYRPKSPLPAHVTLITEGRYGMDLIDLIGPARLVVLPVKEMMVSAAQTAMLESLALGRPLVVSANLATVEYAEHLKTAVFCRPSDVAAMSDCIRLLLDNPVFAEALAKRASLAARALPARNLKTFLGVIGAVAGYRD